MLAITLLVVSAPCLAVGLLQPPPPTAAVPVSIVGNISQTFEYDSNPLLSQTVFRPIWGSITEPSFTVTGTTSTLRLDLTTKLDVRQFNQSRFSSNDVHTTATASATGQILFGKIVASFDYDTTQTSELLTSGLNVAGIRHTGVSIAPELGAILTPTDQLVLDATYQTAVYGNTKIFTNFASVTFNPSFVHNFTQDDAGLLVVQSGYFNTTSGTPARDESVGAGLGWQRRFNGRLSATLSGGANWNDSFSGANGPFIPASSKSSLGYFYNLSGDYAGDQDQIHLAVSRGLVPQGVATEAVQTSVTGSETHAFTPRFSATVTGTYQRNSYSSVDVADAIALSNGAAGDVDIEAALRYQLSENFAITPTFRYRNKEFINDAAVSDSKALLVSFVFTPHAAAFGW